MWKYRDGGTTPTSHPKTTAHIMTPRESRSPTNERANIRARASHTLQTVRPRENSNVVASYRASWTRTLRIINANAMPKTPAGKIPKRHM